MSDDAYKNPKYARVHLTYEFLRDLATFGIITNFDRATYYVHLDAELAYFVKKKEELFKKLKPLNIYIQTGKRISAPRASENIKKDKFDNPEKYLDKHMKSAGFENTYLYDSGESDSEMSSLSDDSDVDEYSRQQKTDMTYLNSG